MIIHPQCVRCEGDILAGEPRKPGRARPTGDRWGFRHTSCPRELLLAKQARDNERNRLQQLQDAAHRRAVRDNDDKPRWLVERERDGRDMHG